MGVLLVGVGFLFSVPWYIVPHLEKTLLSGSSRLSSLFFCLLYPFSAGIAIANLAYPSVTFTAALTASVAMIGYTILAVIAGRWSLETVKRISEGTGVKIVRTQPRISQLKHAIPCWAM